MAIIRHESVLALLNMEEVISALPYPVIVVSGENTIIYLNGEGENFFKKGRERIIEQSLFQLFPIDSPIHTLLSKVRSDGLSISEYDVDLKFQKGDGKRLFTSIALLNDGSGIVVISIHISSEIVRHEIAQNSTEQKIFPKDNENLARSVERHLKKYFDAHRGELPAPGLYDRILREVERPLISLTLSVTSGNQVRAARVLGLNRNTLRKKIRELNIDIVRSSQ